MTPERKKANKRRRRRVRADALASLAFGLCLLVAKQDRKDGILGCPTTLVDVAEEPAGGFGPLKAVLGAISAAHANHKVRL